MNKEFELVEWLNEGNLFKAEKIYIELIQENYIFSNSEIKIRVVSELVEHYQGLAGKAILAKDSKLLEQCIRKLIIHKCPVSDLQKSFEKIKRNSLLLQLLLLLIVGSILFLFMQIIEFS